MVSAATRNTYGAVYFSYEDAWVQGGMNEQGLALDWATTQPEQVTLDHTKSGPRGNLGRLYAGNLNERILKTCATVADVLALYGQNNEIAFFNAHVLVADRSGASVILEWHEGKFTVLPKSGLYQAMTNFNLTDAQTQGYACSRYDSILSTLRNKQAAQLEDAKVALRRASDYLTQYSYILDLKKGTILLYDKRNFTKERTYVLQEELRKPAHIETTAGKAWSINPDIRKIGAMNNQNLLAVGSGRIIIIALCIVFAALSVWMAIRIKSSRIYILPTAGGLTFIALAVGLMHYGYFLRYGFTLPQHILLCLPILFCALAAAQLVLAIALLIRGKFKKFLPFCLHAVLSAAVATVMGATVLF